MELSENDTGLLKSHSGNATHAESEGHSMTMRGRHVKERKNCNEGIQTILLQPEGKNIEVSNVDERNSKQYSRKQEKKLKKKRKKKEKSTADGSDRSKATEGDEHGSYEWAEKTHETLGISTAYQAQTNGHCRTGTCKPGECCHMAEEVKHDHREHNAYARKFNRGKPKKVKHRHKGSYHMPYNHNSTYRHHHKQDAAGNKEYHNGNKFHNQYSETGRCRH
jgi:hypothetical protein